MRSWTRGLDAAIEVIGVDWRNRKHNRDQFFDTWGANELTFVNDAVREQIRDIKWQLFAERQETCIGFGFEGQRDYLIIRFILCMLWSIDVTYS